MEAFLQSWYVFFISNCPKHDIRLQLNSNGHLCSKLCIFSRLHLLLIWCLHRHMRWKIELEISQICCHAQLLHKIIFLLLFSDWGHDYKQIASGLAFCILQLKSTQISICCMIFKIFEFKKKNYFIIFRCYRDILILNIFVRNCYKKKLNHFKETTYWQVVKMVNRFISDAFPNSQSIINKLNLVGDFVSKCNINPTHGQSVGTINVQSPCPSVLAVTNRISIFEFLIWVLYTIERIWMLFFVIFLGLSFFTFSPSSWILIEML